MMAFFPWSCIFGVSKQFCSDSLSYICGAVRPSAVLGPDQTEQSCPKPSLPLTAFFLMYFAPPNPHLFSQSGALQFDFFIKLTEALFCTECIFAQGVDLVCLLGTVVLSVRCIYIFYQLFYTHKYVCRASVCSNNDCFLFPGVGGAVWERPCRFAGTHQDGAALSVQPKRSNTHHIL